MRGVTLEPLSSPAGHPEDVDTRPPGPLDKTLTNKSSSFVFEISLFCPCQLHFVHNSQSKPFLLRGAADERRPNDSPLVDSTVRGGQPQKHRHLQDSC